MGDFNFSDENYVKAEETEEEKETRRKKEADRPKSKFEKVLTEAEIAAKEKEEAEVVSHELSCYIYNPFMHPFNTPSLLHYT